MDYISSQNWTTTLPGNLCLNESINRRDSKLTPLGANRKNNYEQGTGKTTLYPGNGYYVPSDKSWIKLHERRFIPPCNRPDAIEFDSEEKFLDYVKQRDRTDDWRFTGPPRPNHFNDKNPGFAGFPALKLNGYPFNPYNLHKSGSMPIQSAGTRGVYQSSQLDLTRSACARFPAWRQPRGYYGYYHEQLDTRKCVPNNIMGCVTGELPYEPAVLRNDEDLLKAEYCCTHPAFSCDMTGMKTPPRENNAPMPITKSK